MRAILKILDNAFYFILFITALFLVAITPFVALYGFSNVMSYFLQHVVRYRRQTIRKNLILAFPAMSKSDRRNLEREYYRNLSDIAIEALKGFTLTKKQLKKRYRIQNPEILDKLWERDESVIGLTGHIANWEWGALSAGIQIRHRPIAFYKELTNPLIDRLMKWTRAKKGTSMVSIKHTAETFQKTKGQRCIYLLVADQSPVDISKSFWVNFLGQDTPCLHGPEKYAHLYNYTLIFLDIERAGRGYYNVVLRELLKNPASLPMGEVTRKYMSMLEDTIRRNPSKWLWSHKRWKRKRPAYLIENSPSLDSILRV